MWEVEFFWFVYEEKIQYFQKKINKYFFFILKKILNFFKSLKESKKKKMDIDSDFENTEWYLALKKVNKFILLPEYPEWQIRR